MSANNGGPAFPTMKSWDENFCDEAGYARTRRLSGAVGGMTLRDYFAAKAMQSLVNGLSDNDRMAVLDGVLGFARISATAYCAADAMLRAREAT